MLSLPFFVAVYNAICWSSFCIFKRLKGVSCKRRLLLEYLYSLLLQMWCQYQEWYTWVNRLWEFSMLLICEYTKVWKAVIVNITKTYVVVWKLDTLSIQYWTALGVFNAYVRAWTASAVTYKSTIVMTTVVGIGFVISTVFIATCC